MFLDARGIISIVQRDLPVFCLLLLNSPSGADLPFKPLFTIPKGHQKLPELKMVKSLHALGQVPILKAY